MTAEPTPGPAADADPEEHAGFTVYGTDDTPGHKAYYIHLEAQPGKEDELQKFLSDIHAGVDQEPGTGPWFALRFSQRVFGVFEAFPDAEARHTHDMGPGGRNFVTRPDDLDALLAQPARLYRLDVLHAKTNVMFGQPFAPIQ